LKPKKELSAEVATPPKETSPAQVAVNAKPDDSGSSNLPSFLDINSLVSTTATEVVTAEKKDLKTISAAPEDTARKTTTTAAASRQARKGSIEVDPSLPGARPVKIQAAQETTPVSTKSSGTAAASRTGSSRRRVKAVTPEDLRPNPPNKVVKAEPDVNAETKPGTISGADTLVIDFQEKQTVATVENSIQADSKGQTPGAEVAVAAETAPARVAPKRVTSVPAQTGEPETELADLRPSQLYKQRKKAGEIMRVSMTDQLSPQMRRQVKKTMADILEEYNAMTE
jgi:hypothetical protein